MSPKPKRNLELDLHLEPKTTDELLSLEDLDPDYDPEAQEFDGPDELMQLDDMEIDLGDVEDKELQDLVVTRMEGPEAAAGKGVLK